MAVELRVLGGPQLVSADGRVLHTVLAQPKRLALLAFLAVDRRSPTHQRDELLALLWPDLPDDKARNALSQALSFLRRAVGDTTIVSIGVDAVGVDRTRVSCDAASLMEASARGDHERVLELFRGDLLHGLHVDGVPALDRWIEAERRVLRDRALASSRALVTRHDRAANHTEALRWAERAASIAPDDSAVVQELMRLHHQAGNRTAALRVYDDHARRLRVELDLTPDAAVVALAARVRAHDAPGAVETPATVGEIQARRPVLPRRLRPRMIAVAATSALAAVVAFASAVRWANGSASVRPRVRFALALEDSARIPPEANGVTIAVSRDGSELAYVGGLGPSRLFLRQFENLTARAIPGTENARNPSFSPDGKWLAFKAAMALRRMPVRGGPIQIIADTVQRYSWGDGGTIVFDRQQVHASRSLWQVNEDGSDLRLLSQVDSARGETARTWPHVLPGGEAALFTIQSGGYATSELAAIRLADRHVVRLGVKGLNPRYVPNGFIVYGRPDGTVVAIPFDAKRLVVTGRETPVLADVAVKEGGAVELDVAPNGTLVYARYPTSRRLVVLDRNGLSRTVLADQRGYRQPRFSPDAKRIAVVIQDRGSSDVWIGDVASGALTRLTSSGLADRPEWSRDGRMLYWRETDGVRTRILSQSADGSGSPTLFADSVQTLLTSPSGRFFAAIPARYGPARVGIVLFDPLAPTAKTPLVDSRDGPVMARVSPDGKWIAFGVGLAAERELVVQPIPPTGARHRIAGVGASDPVWGANSNELFYRSGGKLIRASLDWTRDEIVTRRDSLLDDTFWHSDNSRFADYDVSRDGKQLVAVKLSGEQVRLTVVFGWADELKERFDRR
jgi:serine/threonine-protein kinase